MTEDVHRERELKFDVPGEFTVPDVSAVLAGTEVEHRVVDLRSTYYDTVDLDLLSHKITLRRRTGDTDTGWQLKVSAGKARDEIHAPLGDPDEPVPARLGDLLAGVVRPGDLVPVATLSTKRGLTRVHRDGELVVEIADDHVAAATGDDRADVWREVEIELGPAGTEYDLAAYARLLRRSGARPAASASKLARALGRDTGDVRRQRSGEQVADYLAAAHRALIAGDIALRRGDADVHDTRIAVRRIRSVLRVFRDVLVVGGGAAGRALDAELSWYQDLLGSVRDLQVQRARFKTALDELPPELTLGPVAARIESTLLADEAESLAAVTAAIATNRYRRLLGAVASLTATDPVVTGTSRRDLRVEADRAARRAAKQLHRAQRSDDPAQLHRARKAAKRARYAAELVGRSRKTITRYKRLQDVLGDHRDALEAIPLLRRLGAASGTAPGENGFTFGLLYERELETVDRLRHEAKRLRVPH